jgi:hypothetical protein
MTWLYDGEILNDPPEGIMGFVYLIHNLENNRLYIGQKSFYSTLTRPPLKGKKRSRKIVRQSDWQKYYGSNEELKRDLENNGYNCARTVLRYCKSKSELNYWELSEQMSRDVLLDHKYYNSYVGARIARNHLKGLINASNNRSSV